MQPLPKQIVSIITTLALLSYTSCTTTGTRDKILAEPMSADLEAQVLKETGISGAVTGAIVGGLAVGGLTALALAASGASMEEALVGGAVGAVAGATAGGMAGYQMGKKEGQKTVAQAMDRDQVAKYVQGARAYNDHLAKTNDMLASEVKSIRQLNDPRKQKSRLAQVERAAKTELKGVDARVDAREKAIKNLNWPQSDKVAYQKELVTLKKQRDQLRQTLLDLNT
jgi:hypothetical protein